MLFPNVKPGVVLSKTKTKRKPATIADRMDRHVLYQHSVQNVDFELEFMRNTYRDLRDKAPLSLREDFCGTALASAHWVALDKAHTAMAVDIDADVLQWSVDNILPTLKKKQRERLELVEGNVLEVANEPVDVIQAFNFSYWCFQERRTMLEYFTRCHAGLKDDGILFLDAYGGHEAYQCQVEEREVEDFTYIWEQASFNAVTCEQRCHIHFRFKDDSELREAFTYVWRIWGAKELREILEEAGFSKTTLYLQAFDDETEEALDEYEPTDEAEDFACWLGYIVAEK